MSTLVVTSRAADVKPPSTQSSPLVTTPLASNRAVGSGVATPQAKPSGEEPASSASPPASPASASRAAPTPAQAGAAGPLGARGADEEHPTPATTSPAAHRIAFATPRVCQHRDRNQRPDPAASTRRRRPLDPRRQIS